MRIKQLHYISGLIITAFVGLHKSNKSFLLSFFLIIQCGIQQSYLHGQELNKKNFSVFKENGLLGLKDDNGKICITPQYKRLHIEEKNGSFALEYIKSDGSKGILSGKKNFELLIEVDASYKHLDYIGSEQYFSYCKRCSGNDSYKYSGVIDKDEIVIFEDKYIGIVHDGGKLFFIGQAKRVNIPEFDYQYSLFDANGQLLADKKYSRVFSKYGIILAKKREKPVDYWGHLTCIIDSDGKEITDFIFKDGAVYRGIFDENLKLIRLRKDGKHGIYYTDGTPIPCEFPNWNIRLLNHADQTTRKKAELLNNKNLIGFTTNDGKKYFITYQGEAILWD